MMLAITVAAVLLAGALGVQAFLIRRSLRDAARELREINADGDSNRQLRCSLPNRELEELLQQVNQTLEQRQADRISSSRKEQELRRQIANISHDLRTPLTSILGYTELMDGASQEEREEYRTIIEKRARVLQALITAFYDLSRLEAGEYALQFEPVNLYTTLCEIMVAFYRDFTEKGFQLIVNLEEAPLVVSADRNAVTRIFTNLIQNALKHGRTQITVSQKRETDVVVTRVSNDAPDMAAEDVLHVFDRFFTADRMRTGQDTGLGLTIVRQFVERMGHSVNALLEDGVFTIEIRWRTR